MRQLTLTAGTVIVVVLAGSACATKGFVRREVDGVNGKVETLSRRKTTQQQTKENTARPLRSIRGRPVGQSPGAGTAATAQPRDHRARFGRSARPRPAWKQRQSAWCLRSSSTTVREFRSARPFRRNQTKLDGSSELEIRPGCLHRDRGPHGPTGSPDGNGSSAWLARKTKRYLTRLPDSAAQDNVISRDQFAPNGTAQARKSAVVIKVLA